MKKSISPLRYPGGKRALVPFLTEMLESNGCIGGTYIEPFAGGAGAALELLFSGKVSRIVLNDADPGIAAFWLSALGDTENLVKMILSTPVDTITYARSKEIVFYNKNPSRLELGYATLFLNRCNRSGIMTAGMIGGKAQDGKYRLSDRFNREEVARKIREIAKYSNHISFESMDAVDFVSKFWANNSSSSSMVYLDPPYYEQGPSLYRKSFDDTAHFRLAKFLQENDNDKKWILSYDDHLFIRNTYSWAEKGFFNFFHTARQFKKGRELILASKEMHLPSEKNKYSLEVDPVKLLESYRLDIPYLFRFPSYLRN